MKDSSDLLKKLTIDLPYPPVTLTKNDCQYAATISDAYAGKGSETTAFNQYKVHRFYLKKLPEIYEAYQILASAEMIHQELLGDIVIRLGVAPKLSSRITNCYWNGGFIHYRSQLLPIFESDAQEERNAIAHYKLLIETIPNQSMQELFKRIIMDEERHLAYLESLIEEFRQSNRQTPF